MPFAPEAFQKYDLDGDGMIDFKELAALMRGLAGTPVTPWEDHEVRALLKAMDSDNDGKVLLTEFGTWLFGQQMSKDEESLLKTAELKLTTPKGAKEGTGMNSKDSSKAAGKAVKAHGKAEGSGLTKSASTSSKRSDTSARDKHPQVLLPKRKRFFLLKPAPPFTQLSKELR